MRSVNGPLEIFANLTTFPRLRKVNVLDRFTAYFIFDASANVNTGTLCEWWD